MMEQHPRSIPSLDSDEISTHSSDYQHSDALVRTPRTPPRAYASRIRITDESLMNVMSLSPTTTVNELPGVICESPKEGLMFQEPFPLGVGILAGHNAVSDAGYTTAEPAPFIRKPIECTFPSRAPRYESTIEIANTLGPWRLRPLESLAIHEDRPIPDWSLHVHPEGQPYFQNISPERTFSFLTEANLFEDNILDEINCFIGAFEHRASRHPLPKNVEVVLQPTEKLWLYYMVDLDRRAVFWIDPISLDDEGILPQNFGVANLKQLRHILDFEFWQHIEYFPCHRPLLPGILDELMGILLHSHIDVVSSLTSHAPYDDNELQSLIGTVKQMQALQKRGSATTYVATASARLMAQYANERFFNFHGFPGARLSVDQSVRGHKPKGRSLLIKALSPLLFNSPETHLLKLEKLWIDETIKGRLWKTFQHKLENDWESFVLYATVLLNANVAFLAIPFVGSNQHPGNSPFWMSPAAILSQISIIASLGSIIVGLLLIRQLRISAKESADDAIAFLGRRNHPRLGLETMAIQYSLPYALLMWGMGTFLAAVMILCFFRIDGLTSLSRRLMYGCIWLFVCVLILWTIVTGWETTRHQVIFSGPRRLLARLFGQSGVRNGGSSDEKEVDDDDARSTTSIRVARTTTKVETRGGKSWQNRLRRMAEKPRRRLSTWRTNTIDTVTFFSGKKNSKSSTLTPVSSIRTLDRGNGKQVQ